LEELQDEFPFQSEALNLALVIGRREIETTKLRYSHITEDS